MKKNKLKASIFLICLTISMLLPQGSYGQLNGKYTINPLLKPSSTNYGDWASAIGDMISATRTDGGKPNGKGVNGAVVFTVYDTIYDKTSLEITEIPGASKTNNITFRSTKGDSTKCMLQYASGTLTTDDWVVYLNGADFITFSKIGFERTGSNTNGTVIQLGNTADNNTFSHCFMKGYKAPSNTTKGFTTGVGSCVFFSGTADTTVLIGNRFLYGYNGIYASTTSSANTISQNLIDTPGSAGIYVWYQSALKVSGNKINLGDFGLNSGQYTSYAIRIDYSPSFVVEGNTAIVTSINSQVSRSFAFVQSSGTLNAPNMVYNNNIFNSGGTINVIGAPVCNGIAVNTCAYLNVFHNNILINSANVDGAAFFQYPSTVNKKINLVNNNLINKSLGYAISAGDTNSNAIDSVNYNNLYTRGTNIALWGSATGKYTTLATFKSATGKCNNCLNVDPLYISNSNLHIINPLLKGAGTPIARVTTDIDGQKRNTLTPDIGSDEFKLLPNDAGITNLVSPINNACAGILPVRVLLKNYGNDTLKNVTINWSVSGTALTSYNWKGKLASMKSDTVTIGNFDFSANLSPKFIVSTSQPNGFAEGLTFNDSLTVNRTLSALPVANAGPDKTICLGDTLNLGLNAVSGLTYQWLSTGGLTLGKTSKLNIQPLVKSSYILEVTNSFGCIKRDTTNISINALPVANAGVDKSVCIGDTINIGPGSTSGMTYIWMSLSGITLGTSSTLDIAPVSITSDYVLQVTNTAQKCSNKDTIKITALTLPAADAGSNQPLCLGSSLQIGNTATSGVTYSWTSNPSGFASTSANPSVSPKVNTTYYLETKEIATGCMNKDSALINIQSVPSILITGSLTSCIADTVTYSTAGGMGDTYNWAVGGGNIISGQNSNSILVNWNTPGIHSLSLLETNDVTCSDNDSIMVSISTLPNAKFGTAKSCFGDATQFTDSSTDATTYVWNFGDGGNSTAANPTHNYAATGTYTTKLIVKNAAGCRHIASKQFDITPLPSVSFTFAKQPARAFNFTSTSTISSGTITSWKWDFGDGTLSSLENPSHQYSSAASFDVKLCAMSAAGCESCTTQNLAVTGINDIAFDKALFVTPNPGSGLFTLNTTEQIATVTITNAMGQIIETIQPNTLNVKFDLSAQAAGMYFIQVNVGGEIKTIKLIKQ
jgi:hypothetical protein